MTASTPPALDGRDADFVREFMIDRDPAAACKRAGISPRKATQLMTNPDIIASIAARQAATATEPAPDSVSLDSLIADARRALRLAESAGNAGAMVSATQTLARLAGKWDGQASELAAEIAGPIDNRDMSRAVIHLLQDAAHTEGWQFGFCGPGERLIRVPASLTHAVGGQPAYAMPPGDDQSPPEPAAVPLSDAELARAIAAVLGPDPLAAIKAAINPNGADEGSSGVTPASGSVSPLLAEPAPFSNSGESNG